MEFRTDEAYHWTWSKEWVVSYLDHPPMIAWFVRLGTAVFGDTLFGARFANIAAILGAELLLADIVRRRTGSLTTAALAVLAMESTIHLGGISVFIEPSIPLILFSSLMFWALSRVEDSGDGRVGGCWSERPLVWRCCPNTWRCSSSLRLSRSCS